MAIRFDEIQLANTAHKFYPKLQGAGSAQYLQIQTSHGYLRLGPNNSSYAHFYTDRGSYYFNQPVRFDGNIQGYDGNEQLHLLCIMILLTLTTMLIHQINQD